MRQIRDGSMALGAVLLLVAASGCDKYTLTGTQVDTFTQDGEDVSDFFTQDGVSQVVRQRGAHGSIIGQE